MYDRKTKHTPIGEPFPLKERFRRRIIPTLIGFVGLSLLIIGLTAKYAVETIYLELAQRRAQTIERSVAESSKDAWSSLMAGQNLAELQKTTDAEILANAFASEVRQQNLLELKVYDLNRRVIYATHLNEIGSIENGDALRKVIADSQSGLVTKLFPDGTQQYELYVPVFDVKGQLRTVFELYEPVDYLDAILIRSAIPIITIPGFLFFLLGLALDRIVRSAQSDINMRSTMIDELRKRLESLVSSSAADAARDLSSGTEIPSKRITTTLFFSDVRDFTGFSEQHSPEEVVHFLNDVMTLQVEILEKHGGDIDKMIGDAVLARFDRKDGRAQSVRAAQEIQAAVKKAQLPRLLGIGIYTGEVISGTIGPASRRDFTVIGDAVNVASRLCSSAKAGEIVVEAGLADEGFDAKETISVKGRETPIEIRRDRNSVT